MGSEASAREGVAATLLHCLQQHSPASPSSASSSSSSATSLSSWSSSSTLSSTTTTSKPYPPASPPSLLRRRLAPNSPLASSLPPISTVSASSATATPTATTASTSTTVTTATSGDVEASALESFVVAHRGVYAFDAAVYERLLRLLTTDRFANGWVGAVLMKGDDDDDVDDDDDDDESIQADGECLGNESDTGLDDFRKKRRYRLSYQAMWCGEMTASRLTTLTVTGFHQ
jgi:hypothetical protein